MSNRLKNAPGSVWGWTWKQNGHMMPPPQSGPSGNFSFILAHFGRFEAPLWANLAPKGGPRLPKWRPKSMKNRCQDRRRKIDGKLIKKASILRGSRTEKTGQNVELSSISAFRRFRHRDRLRTPKMAKKGCQEEVQTEPKST